MKELKKTSRFGKAGSGHYHVAYTNEEAKYGQTSLNKGHQHQIVWQDYQPPRDPQYDEMGNLLDPGAPEVQAGWIVQPDPTDGHTHTLEDYEAAPKQEEKEEDEDVVRDVLQLYRTAKEIESDSIEKGQESEDFYKGEQWEESDKSALEATARAATTVNDIEKNIDELSGYQRQQRSDIHYLPQEDGDQRVADILNVATKRILSDGLFEREESKVFLDVLKTGRGCFNIYVDFNSDLQGKPRVERFQWDGVFFGPHEKEDLEDCEYIVKSKMFSRSKAKQLWGDKADEIQLCFDEVLSGGPTLKGWSDDGYDHPDKKTPTSVTVAGDVMVDTAKKEIRVLECWRRIYQPSKVAANPADEFFQNITNWDDKDIESVKTIQGFTLVSRTLPKMRITKIAGNVVLSDENPADLPADDFHLVPVYAKKSGNDFWGKIEPVKDAQRCKNKRYSQVIDIINKMCAYGWVIDDTTFPDDKEKERFKKNAATPGFIAEVQDSNRPPRQIEGTKFPGEVVQLLEMDSQTISSLMNIQVTNAGANTSGTAILAAQKQKLTGNEYLFDNLAFAKRKLGKLLVGVIQRYYSPARIYRLLVNTNQREDVQLAGQPLSSFTEEDIHKLLKDHDLTSYDVVVSEQDWSPTVRIATFQVLSELAKSGQPISPAVLIKFLDLPQQTRDELLADIQQQTDAASQQADDTHSTEIEKTLIAHGHIPPEVAQKYGLQSPGQPLTDSEDGAQTDFSQNDGSNSGLAG